MTNLVAELESKRTADGSSAATGLKHVRMNTMMKHGCDMKNVVFTLCFLLLRR